MSTFLGLYEQRTELQAGATPALVEGAFDVLALAAPDPGH
jgi:DNA primase